ncbi:MAG TPA: 50S ribosomal protein L10 [Saprospiraceae bacterium]|nr:50S ribosomal protein L10 [Saprospiraceae bacterium]HMX87912.1 50S ribosomal protein L10 [Saprospiraceae bacterium]HMZ39760.1 50S ribosomal protein L10 [Saprospiraceae bacterium]HNA63368.1 50S ribosomal protein L10 [Saprospiraceae bacterium]HNB31304.1 50S ribosomal protein L10 [Saprospiraceae bacterium]
MTREEKSQEILDLKEKFSNAQFFYVTDSSTLTVEQVNNLRRLCFNQGIELKVVKNTLAKKALQSIEKNGEFGPVYTALEGPSAIMFSENAKAPAILIEEFRKENSKPTLKAAYIDSDVYLGDDQIEVLVKLKSKEDLIGEIIMILQSPAKNVISALKSGGSTIAGIVKALEERAQ